MNRFQNECLIFYVFCIIIFQLIHFETNLFVPNWTPILFQIDQKFVRLKLLTHLLPISSSAAHWVKRPMINRFCSADTSDQLIPPPPNECPFPFSLNIFCFYTFSIRIKWQWLKYDLGSFLSLCFPIPILCCTYYRLISNFYTLFKKGVNVLIHAHFVLLLHFCRRVFFWLVQLKFFYWLLSVKMQFVGSDFLLKLF